jgi:outer membrane biosynthesis protein TonB
VDTTLRQKPKLLRECSYAVDSEVLFGRHAQGRHTDAAPRCAIQTDVSFFSCSSRPNSTETPEPQSAAHDAGDTQVRGATEGRAVESPKRLDFSANAAPSPSKAAPSPAKVEASTTPTLEQSPASKKETRAKKQLETLLELCVNREAAGGLDVKQLVSKLHAQERRLETMGAQLAEERGANEVLRARLELMERSEGGAAFVECEKLREAVAAAEADRDRARNLLDTLQASMLQQAAAEAAPVARKKVWKKPPPAAGEAVVAPPPPQQQPTTAQTPIVVEDSPEPVVPKKEKAPTPKKGRPPKRQASKVPRVAPPPTASDSSESESDESDSDVKEIAPPKRRKTTSAVAAAAAPAEEFFCDYESVATPVRLDDADLLVTADKAAHYRAFYKGATRFALGDSVYLTPPGGVEEDYVGRIADIREADKGAVVEVQWYFRWQDLPDELKDNRASELGRTRELWLSDAHDENPAATVVGRFRVIDGNAMKRPEAQKYVDASEHHYFTRKSLSMEALQFVPLEGV